jgi:NAD-dependent SIR2 family protein deacetylase
MTPLDLQFQEAADIIANADALIIGAGAGIGVDSGLPDFRGNEGFWKAYPALAKAQLNFTEVASPRTFQQDPELAWGFYGHRLALYRQTIPHPGFAILRKWSERMPFGARVFTSNVDGQFQKAGFSEDMVHECHGSIHHLQCMNECESDIWSAENFVPEVDVETCQLLNELPVCPHCGGLARPNLLMFGDWNWISKRSDVQIRAESNWLSSIAEVSPRIVIVEIGAGSVIPSVRQFSHRISLDYGACLIRMNPRESQVPSSRDIGFATGSLEALRGIDLVIESSSAQSLG